MDCNLYQNLSFSNYYLTITYSYFYKNMAIIFPHKKATRCEKYSTTCRLSLFFLNVTLR